MGDPADRRFTYLVAGASSEIGAEVVAGLSREGKHCLAIGRDEARLISALDAAEVEESHVKTFVGDITSADSRGQMLREWVEHGQPAGLVNAVGFSIWSELGEVSEDEWRQVMEVNLDAAFFLARDCLVQMAPEGVGRIVTIGSHYGTHALDSRLYDRGNFIPADLLDKQWYRATSYNASKAAVIAMTRDLAVAGAAHGITVNSVSPGGIAVETRPMSAERRAKFEAAIPLGRLGSPREIAAAVLFLLSAEATYITGADIVVDGGWSIW